MVHYGRPLVPHTAQAPGVIKTKYLRGENLFYYRMCVNDQGRFRSMPNAIRNNFKTWLPSVIGHLVASKTHLVDDLLHIYSWPLLSLQSSESHTAPPLSNDAPAL